MPITKKGSTIIMGVLFYLLSQVASMKPVPDHLRLSAMDIYNNPGSCPNNHCCISLHRIKEYLTLQKDRKTAF